MENFNYKEIDAQGHHTLSVISEATKLNHWFYSAIKPFCKGRILEIGSGIGNISSFFLQHKADITLSDIRESYLGVIKKRFPDVSHSNIALLDLVHPDFDNQYSHLLNSFDTIFALNVVEHIKEDQKAIDNCYKLLRKGGNLIILVPSYQALYNHFDVELEHYRRYTKKTLSALFDQAHFHIIHRQYFNFAGLPGWFISGKILKNKLIPEGQMKFYNSLVPVFKLADKLIFNAAGLSVIVVGQK